MFFLCIWESKCSKLRNWKYYQFSCISKSAYEKSAENSVFSDHHLPVDTGRKLNVHKTLRRRPGRLLNVLCTFILRPVSTGLVWTVRRYDGIQPYPDYPTFSEPAENHAERMSNEEKKDNKVYVGNFAKCRPSMKGYVTEKLLKFRRFSWFFAGFLKFSWFEKIWKSCR